MSCDEMVPSGSSRSSAATVQSELRSSVEASRGAGTADSPINPSSTITSLYLKPFQVGAILADNAVCGGYDGGFVTELTMHVEDLDKDGYVVHNEGFIEDVRRAFARSMLKASCEELARGMAHMAHKACKGRLVSVSAKVFNLTGHASCNWSQGQTVPPFPREATRAEREVTEDARRRGEVPKPC